MKTCTKCGVEKPETEFGKNAARKDGSHCHCKACSCESRAKWRHENLEHIRAYSKKWKQDNLDQVKAREKEWRQKNGGRLKMIGKKWTLENAEKILDRDFRRNYGVSLIEYDELVLNQGGTCAICEKEDITGRKLSVDHDHTTGKVRGLLCGCCNRALGLLKDDPALFGSAQKYLNRATLIPC